MADTTAPQPAAAKPPALQIKQLKAVNLPGSHYSIAHAAGTEQVFVGGDTGRLQWLDLAEEKPKPVAWDAHVGYVSGLVLTPTHIVSSGSDHRMVWWNRDGREKVREIEQPKWIRHLSLSRDGRIIASVCDDMVCRLWEAESGRLARELAGHAPLTPGRHEPSMLYASAFSRDGKFLATVDRIGHAVVWETATGRKLVDVHAPFFWFSGNGTATGGIRGVDFSPDGTQIALCGYLYTGESNSPSLMQVYDWQSGRQTAECRLGGTFRFERVRFHHEGRWLIGGGSEHRAGPPKLVIFDLATKTVAAQAEKYLLHDLVLTETSDTCYTSGTFNVCKWGITSGA